MLHLLGSFIRFSKDGLRTSYTLNIWQPLQVQVPGLCPRPNKSFPGQVVRESIYFSNKLSR